MELRVSSGFGLPASRTPHPSGPPLSDPSCSSLDAFRDWPRARREPVPEDPRLQPRSHLNGLLGTEARALCCDGVSIHPESASLRCVHVHQRLLLHERQIVAGARASFRWESKRPHPFYSPPPQLKQGGRFSPETIGQYLRELCTPGADPCCLTRVQDRHRSVLNHWHPDPESALTFSFLFLSLQLQSKLNGPSCTFAP